MGYEFQTLGVSIRMLFVFGWRFNFHAGSSAGIGFMPFNQNLIIGVNVVAIAAVVYLNRIISEGTREAAPNHGIGLI